MVVKTKVIAASAMAALLLLGVGAIAFAHSGILGPNNSSNNSQGEQGDDHRASQATTQHDDNESDNGADHEHEGGLNLTVGQTLTFSGLTGHFNNLTSESSEHDDEDNSGAGNATGSFTFKVTGVSTDGANLTITSGTFAINGTTYTVSGGAVTLHEEDRSGNGSGTASGGAAFNIFIAGIHGNPSSSSLDGHFKLNVKIGTSEYHLLLGTPEAPEDSSED